MDFFRWAGFAFEVEEMEAPLCEDLVPLRDLWREKCRGRPVPDRADFDLPFEIRPWLSNMLILDVERDPIDFRSRLVGEDVERIEERRYLGKKLADAGYGPLEPAVRRINEKVATGVQMSAVYTVTVVGFVLKKVETLYLPLTKGGTEVAIILCAMKDVRGRN